MTNLLFFQKLLLMLTALSIIIITTGCVDDSVPHEELNQDLLALRLTEIHYHPLALEGFTDDSLEFLEIKNIGSSQLNLDKLQFTLGITFLFPSGCKIAPNDFFVIASNNNAFKLRYGFYPDGEYSGQLKNSGETIELTDAASRNVIFSQTYSDSGSWPGSADGDGYSLVPVNLNPGKDETDSESWRPSTNIHGSPGADDVLKTVDSSLFNLRITEINYHPECADTTIEDSLEFIEIKNVGEKTLNLSGVAIDSAVEFKFDSSAGIKPGAFLILASNVKWFRQYYGFEPFGAFKGQLKNSGETILVRDRKAAIELFRISYRDRNPWPSEADGEGRTLVPIHANPIIDEQNNPASWRPSFTTDGSPGRDDPEAVLVNEVLTHTDPPQVDAIELYNPNQVDVDLGGWYLSDDIGNPIKYRIPEGTVIKAGSYKVFTEKEFNADSTLPSSFRFSESGDDAVLSADSNGCRGYCHSFSFGALERGISFGRYIVPSTGNELFVAMANVTLGATNSESLVGPLIMSEIMCQSAQGDADFLEITNISNQEVKLYDPKYPDNVWRIQIDTTFFFFPKDKSVKAGESIIVKCGSATVETFRNKNSIGADVQIFSFDAALPNLSAKVELEKPMEPNKDDTETGIEYMEYDKVSYKNEAPWPVRNDNEIVSLTRINNNKFGNDPANWLSAVPTPGIVK